MRISGCLAMLLGLIWVPAACAGGVRIAGPAISIKPASHDFGTVPQGGIFTTEVTIRNEGTAVLNIFDVASDCGCTAAQLPDTVLVPGEETQLIVTFASHAFSGRVLKHIFIETNDPGMPRSSLGLTAFVRPWIRVEPDGLEFGNVPAGSTPAQIVTLTSAAGDGLKILKLDYPNELFAADVEQAISGDSLVHRVRFRILPGARLGAFRTHADLQTNHPKADHVRLRLNGQIHGFFRVDPTTLSFGQLRAGTERTRQVRLLATAPGRHRVIAASSTDERLAVRVQKLDGDRDYAVLLTLPATMPPGSIKAALIIETDDPAQPRLEIPVRGRVRSLAGDDEPMILDESEEEGDQP
ncbi:MAG: DUF1573 domain-containing protein [Candidatus Eisenbacteria bacterium]